jgi:phosphatidylserine/phosphatidylglycerophosphate/cardiolipin synthase-like enzyme
MPDEQDIVIFGSHNLNSASTFVNDEVSFEIRGHLFAEYMDQIFENSLFLNSSPLKLKQIENENWWNNLFGWGWRGWGWNWLANISESMI